MSIASRLKSHVHVRREQFVVSKYSNRSTPSSNSISASTISFLSCCSSLHLSLPADRLQGDDSGLYLALAPLALALWNLDGGVRHGPFSLLVLSPES